MPHLRIFLSTVSAEFRTYRDALRHDLTRPNVSVAVQEDFIVTGTETLDMLDDYIRQCDAVIHLVGDMSGAPAQAPSLAVIRSRYPDLGEKLPPLAGFLQPGAAALSYTQWEAWLALYHGKPLIIAVPEAGAPRDACYELIPEQRAAQEAHLQHLAEVERYPGIRFGSPERLAVDVLRSKLFDLFVAAGIAKRVINLPYPSLNELFKGREQMLADLHTRLSSAPANAASAIVGKALHGLGGVGKTRLAVEYAWRHLDDYAALLLVDADDPETLQRNLAALCAPALLDLPEHQVTEEAAQISAVLAWLQRNPGWLLIVDNVDTEAAAQAVEALLPQLPGGHVLITSRLSNWSGGVEALPLDVLQEPAAVDFLLARTDARRRKEADDAAQARTLVGELGGLALALEQAGAYIAQRRLTLAGYLVEWRGQRDKVLAWYDPRLMQYPKSVAVTWQTSFDQLGEPARLLLRRLAWLAAAPIPESLLDVAAPGAAEDDGYAALAELESYSLVTRADETPSFTVHRLVQEVTRRGADAATLGEALGWIDDAFVGTTQDVRDWPVLDPLLPHVRAVAGHAHEVGIAAPNVRLMNQAGLLLLGKALHAEAEPLMRRALAIDEQSFGVEHPDVARGLNNLAQLLQATNRLAEAEPLMRRALAIDEQSFSAEHPNVAIRLNNLAQLLQATNHLAEAEPLMRRALAIDEQSFGAEHPRVVIDLNNLAALLQATNRLAEAEPLMRRALAIDEQSFGAEHPNVARGLNNLAQLLQATNRLAEAEPLMRQALAIDEQSFGAEHPDVARDLNNLALLLQATNRLAEAEPLMRRALTILVASLGADHPNSLIVRRNYDAVLLASGAKDR